MLNDRLSIIAHRHRRLSTETTHPSPPREPPRRDPIEAVLFDLCGVLYDDSLWQRWLLQLVSRMGLHTHYRLFYRLWECEFQEDVAYGRIEYWQALRMFLESAGLSRGQIDEIIAAGRPRFRAFQEQVRAYPHVMATLARLSGQGVRLVIASTVPMSSEERKSKLTRLQLDRWFVSVLSPCDLPRPTSLSDWFQDAASSCHTPPSRAAFVGRKRETLAAASQAGLLTVAFNQNADAVADIYLEQFNQLPRLCPWGSPPMLAAG